MNEMEKIGRPGDLAIFKPGMNRAIDVRTQLLSVPEVIQILSPIESRILQASVKTPIADIPDEELMRKIGALGKYIARDAGIRTVDDYSLTRFVDVLKSYYPSYSLQEVRMAFELAMAGNLDEFLPRDKDGNPDKNHYQTFNIEYITKILNAYKKRRQETEYKAYTALPQPDREMSPATMAYYRREMKRGVIASFLAYKYRGKFPDNVNLYSIYSELDKLGLVEPIQVTEADKKEAVSRLLRKAHTGVIKGFIAECIRRQQTRHSDVISEAGLIAKEKALIKSFEIMAKEEIQITDYITLN